MMDRLAQRKRIKWKMCKNIETHEEDSASEETRSDSPIGGGETK
jgi:hypothetical protein